MMKMKWRRQTLKKGGEMRKVRHTEKWKKRTNR
jgi:hypothetical protein